MQLASVGLPLVDVLRALHSLFIRELSEKDMLTSMTTTEHCGYLPATVVVGMSCF